MLGTRIVRQPITPALLCLATLLSSCQTATQEAVLDDYTLELAPGQLGLVPLPKGSAWPDFSIGWPIREHMVDAADASLTYLSKPSSKGFFPYGPISHDRMVRSLKRFRKLLETSPSAEVFLNGLRNEFEVWVARGGSNTGDVLFTGYGTPIYQGSRTRSSVHQYPLYKLPGDLVKADNGDFLGRRTASGNIVPYYTHRELVEGNHLVGQELVWLSDAFDAYTAQVQGSAMIDLPDGTRLEVGYAGKNGYDYKSIGQLLIDEGKIRKSELSLARLRRYFRENPNEVSRVLPMNPSFVFFQETPGGPYGCLGQPVTEMRSVATDKDVFPRAGLMFIEVRLPDFAPHGGLVQRPERFFAFDQDRGGAIRSAGRCDIWMGLGEDAMERAGHVLSRGRMYYLFLKD
ncbi:MAG: MltA domain-containing protein [Planctomycetes bacterium]|nr:MltA domain-containing protein [Planctomycetota bacterium]